MKHRYRNNRGRNNRGRNNQGRNNNQGHNNRGCNYNHFGHQHQVFKQHSKPNWYRRQNRNRRHSHQEHQMIPSENSYEDNDLIQYERQGHNCLRCGYSTKQKQKLHKHIMENHLEIQSIEPGYIHKETGQPYFRCKFTGYKRGIIDVHISRNQLLRSKCYHKYRTACLLKKRIREQSQTMEIDNDDGNTHCKYHRYQHFLVNNVNFFICVMPNCQHQVYLNTNVMHMQN